MSTINTDILKAYARGELSPAQEREVEGYLLKNPLANDAIDGFKILEKDKINTTIALGDLRTQLASKTQKQAQVKPLLSWKTIVPLAASVVIVAGVFWLNFEKKIPPAQEVTSVASVKESPKTAPLATPEKTQKELPQQLKFSPPEVIITSKDSEKEEVAISKPNEKSAVKTEEPPQSSSAIALDENASQPSSVVAAAPSARMSQVPPSIPDDVTNKASEKSMNTSRNREASENKLAGTYESAKNLEKDKYEREDSKVVKSMDAKSKDPFDETRKNDDEQRPVQMSRSKAEFGVQNPITGKSWSYNVANHEAQPTGGFEEWAEYIKKNQKKGLGKGLVKISFWVEKDGSLSDFKVIQNLNQDAENEAIRLIKDGVKWIPKVVNANPKRKRIEQTFVFEE
jgi:hypothetical protein